MITNKYLSSALLLVAIFSIVIFACDVTNTDNQTQPQPQLQVQAVTNLAVLTYSNTNTLYASWSPSSTPNLVQYYLLEITSTSDANPIRSERIYSNSITSFRTGLTAGTYTVTITAVAADNSKSTGVTSSEITIVTSATAPTVINPVAANIATALNGDWASITIPAPAGTSGTETDGVTPAQIVGYTLYYKQGNTVAINNYDNKVYITKAQVDATQLPIIDLLKPGTMYAFRIAIHNSAGVLGVGDIFTVTTAAKPDNNVAKAPAAPTNVQAQASLTEDKITVSWDAPVSAGKKTDGSDDTLSKYKVYWDEVTATTPTASRNSRNVIEINSSTTTATLTTNRDITKIYSVIVLAENTAGLYAISNAVHTIPAPTDKATPITVVTFDSIQAGDITANSMKVRWTTDISKALTPQGVALTNNQVQFKIYYAEQPTPAYTTAAQVIEAATAKATIVNIAAVATAADAITSSTTITGLKMDTAYQVVVQAINTTAISLLTNSGIQNFKSLIDLDQLTISYEDTVLYLQAASVSISPTINRIINNDDAISYSITHKSGDATAATVQIDAKSGALQLDAKKLSTSSIVYTIQVSPTADKAIGSTKTIEYTILGIEEATCNVRLVKNGNVYEISEPKDLFLITSTGLDKSYSLKNDITIPATDQSCYSYIDTATNTIKFGATKQRTISFSNFEPIGNATDKFTGSFNGNNHTISGLKINKSTISNIGLFGYIENATIQNLVIDHEGIQGRENVGALAGRTTNSTITNAGMKSSTTSTVSGIGYYTAGLVGRIENSSTVSGYATGAVNGNGYVGGLVGYVGSNSTVSGYATGAVSGSVYVGGLMGSVDRSSTVSGYATGAVSGSSWYVGGLVGWLDNNSTVSGYATGAVSGTVYVGGLVGKVDKNSTMSGYATGAVSGTGSVGGLVGEVDNNSTVSGYATGAVSGTGSVGGLVGNKVAGTVSGYARGRVTRSSGANTTFGLLAGEGTATGYHSANESSFVNITKTARTGIDGTAITMGSTITQADFSLLDFSTDVGKWTWVTSTSGKWPAINLGFSTDLSAIAPGDLPNEQ